MKLAYTCEHIDRKHRSLGLCNACYLKRNGGSKRWYKKNRSLTIERAATWAVQNIERRREIALRWILRDNLSDPLQQCICFHYTNLQPLWWFENLAKGGKYAY